MGWVGAAEQMLYQERWHADGLEKQNKEHDIVFAGSSGMVLHEIF